MRKLYLFLILLLVFFGTFSSVCGQTSYTTSGDHTFTVPAGVTKIKLECWGAGGAGGGNTSRNDGAGGGGGGAYSSSIITVIPGNTYTVHVGAGGVGSIGNGSNGGDSWFNTASLVMAKGGAGGSVATWSGGTGGIGGSANSSIGTINFNGGNGGIGRNSSIGRGGPGGSSAGINSNGISASNTWITLTANPAPIGGGKGGNGGNSGQNGANGTSPGGGGGGSGDRGSSNRVGGNGANGQVIITLPAQIALSSPNQIATADVYQGTVKHAIFSFQTTVTTSNAIINSISFTTSGSYLANDVDNFQLWYSSTNDIATASQIGSNITTALGVGVHTFAGLTQLTTKGTTGYFWITSNIDINATIGSEISVDAITLSDLNYELATVSGTTTSAGKQIVRGMPRIALSSANPAVSAANVNQGTSNNIIYRFVNTVSVASASLNSVSFTTTGTCTNFDITRFRLWHSTTDNFSTATQIGSDIISGTGAGLHTFNGLSLNNSAGSTNYFWITANIASAPVNSRTIQVSAITTNNLTYTVGLKSGTANAGGVQTIQRLTGIMLTSNFPAVSATSIPQGTQKKEVYKFSTIITGINATINSVSFTTSGNYTAGDVTNFKLWYSEVNSLIGGSTTLLSTINTTLGVGTHTFSGLNKTTNNGNIGYFWITADIALTATPAKTLKVEAITTNNITYSNATIAKSGTAFYGGIQTIQKIVDTDGDGVADLYDFDDDNDGIPDLKENLPCNTSLIELFPNSGFEAGNTGFSSGYGFVNNTYRALWPEGRYAIVDNANIVHDNFANCSSGHGNMMVVNGSVNADLIVWSSGSIAVTPYTDYTLRVQIASVNPANPAQLIFNVNGENIGSQFNATTTNCEWKNAEAIWNSGSSNRATFEVVNLNLVGGGNDFAIDNISCTYRNTCDSDGDGIPDQLDLDSDNDGIYDIVEAGGITAGNGTILGFTDTDGDGLSDNVDNVDSGKGASELQSGIPLANADIDGDGLANTVDLDSDGDLCFDVTEAGFNDGDDDGILGISAVSVNDKGVVTGQGGYTTPADADNNGVLDFMQQVPIINTQPVNSSICLSATSSATFSVGASNAGGTFQWQVSSDNGATWNNIPGATNATLNILGVNASFDLNRYRVQLFHPAYACSPLVSDVAILRAFASVPAQPSVITGDNPVCQNVSGLTYSVALITQATSYNWTLPSGWITESGIGTNAIVASSSSNSGNIRVSATNTCGTGSARSLAVTVANPIPTITSPSFASVCQSADVRYETQAGKSNYIWNITTGSLGADYTIVSGGATTDNYIVIKWQSTGNRTVTINYTSGGCQGSVAGTKTLNVIANAIVSTQPVNPAAVCAGTGSANISISTMGAVTSFQWQVSTDGGSTWTDLSNVAPYSNVTTNTMTITKPAASLNNAQYKCMVIGTCGDIYSNAATLTVNSTNISSQSTDGQTQFVSGSFTPISVTANGTGLSYQWYSNTTASIIGGTSLGIANGAQSDTYTPQANVAGTLYYYCEVSGACGSIKSNISGAFIVLPKPIITENSTHHCGGHSDSFTTTDNADYTYKWTISNCTITDDTTNTVDVTWNNPTAPTTVTVTVKLVVTHKTSGKSVEVTKDVTIIRTPETGEEYHVINNFS